MRVFEAAKEKRGAIGFVLTALAPADKTRAGPRAAGRAAAGHLLEQLCLQSRALQHAGRSDPILALRQFKLILKIAKVLCRSN